MRAAKIPLLAAFLVAMAGLYSGAQPTAMVAGVGTVSVTLVISDNETTETENIYVAQGTTVFDALQTVAVIDYKNYAGLGPLITAINGVGERMETGIPGTADAMIKKLLGWKTDGYRNKPGHYWQYYVDGQLAPVGASSYRITKPAVIEFRYEIPPAF